jgi:transcription elongation factor GreA
MTARPAAHASSVTQGAEASVGTPSSPDDVYLTPEGLLLLHERIRILAETAAELHVALDDAERSPESVEAYQRATRELARLESLVHSAHAIDEVLDDPRVVELGDTVAIRLEDGIVESYVVVHRAEASFDDHWISVESPLGRALLGRRVGETVEVSVPTGSYRCTILSATRSST